MGRNEILCTLVPERFNPVKRVTGFVSGLDVVRYAGLKSEQMHQAVAAAAGDFPRPFVIASLPALSVQHIMWLAAVK